MALPGFGCCDFQLKALNGAVVCGRSMEFPFRQQSAIITFNRNEKFESTAPDGTKGMEWISKYGFTGIGAFHIDAPDEGMNEVGLSFGVLTLTDTVYQTVSEDQKNQALAMMDVGKWILGCFATVAEVKEAIQKVRIWGQFIKPLNSVPGLHIALHDAQGDNGVIEIIDGEIKFYDNPNGVLTNEPQLSWHLENLQNYKHLTPEPTGNEISDIEKGMLGLPGDWSSRSRFVRLSVISHCAVAENEAKAINDATHILNVMDIPRGAVIVDLANQKFKETTLWATVKDLTNRKFYLRPNGDMTLRVIDLKNMVFDCGTFHPKLSVHVEKPTIIDITNQLYPSRVWGFNTLLGTPVPTITASQFEHVPPESKKIISIYDNIKTTETPQNEKEEVKELAQ